jgi:hypothetical protein
MDAPSYFEIEIAASMISKILTSQRLLAFLILGFGVAAAYVFRRSPEPRKSDLARESQATRETTQQAALAPGALSPIFVTADSIDAPSREFQAIAASEKIVVQENHPQPDATVYYPKTFNEGFAKARIGPSIPREYSYDPQQGQNDLSAAGSSGTAVVRRSQDSAADSLRLKPVVPDSYWPDQDYRPPSPRDRSQSNTHFRASLDPPRLITNQSFTDPQSPGILSSAKQEISTENASNANPHRDRDRIESHVIRQPLRQRPN